MVHKEVQNMKCLSCGYELDDDAVFCSQCGKKIELPVKEVAEEVTDTVSEAVSDVKEEVAEVVSAPVEAVEKFADKAEDKIEDVVDDIKDSFADKPVTEPVLTDSSDTVAAIDEVLEALNSQPETAAEDIKDKADSFADNIKDKAEEAVSDESYTEESTFTLGDILDAE